LSIKKYLVSIIIIYCFTFVFGQTEYLSGIVKNASTNKILAGANIQIKNSVLGTSTNENGKFVLNPVSYPTIIIINYIGYKSKEMTVSEAQYIEIMLEETILPGDKINVSGSPKNINIQYEGEIDIISLRQMEYKGYRDAAEVLGEIEGLQIQTTNSGVQKVRIRGSNPNEVSVFIDGIKLNNSFNREANISFVDLSMLENLVIRKGGITTLYGPGNFGGVIFMNTENSDQTYLKGKKTFGLSEHSDSDQILSGGVNYSYFGGNYYRSTRKRLYDGVNLYSSYFTTGGLSIRNKNSTLYWKHLGLINQIEIKNFSYNTSNPAYTVSGDSLIVDQFNFSGNIFSSSGWYITASRRSLSYSDSFYSNIKRSLNDSTTYGVLMKKWQFGSFELIAQIEQENNYYSGIERSDTDITNFYDWMENYVYSQKDNGWAGIARKSILIDSPTIDSLWFEVALRRSKIQINQIDEITYYNLQDGLTTFQDTLDLSHSLSTLRFGFQSMKNTDDKSKVYYFNQGFNYNAPTLSHYMLWRNGRKKLEKIEKDLHSKMTGWVHEDSMVVYTAQLVKNQYYQSIYPVGLDLEYVTSSEAGIKLFENKDGDPLLRWELNAAVYFNRLNNKLVWRNFEDDIIVPDNIKLGSIFGGELSGAAIFPHFKLSGSFGYVHPDQDVLVQILPKTSGQISTELYWKYMNIVVSHYLQGKTQAFRGSTGFINLPGYSNTNMNITLKYNVKKINFMFTYTVHNLMNNDKTILESGLWNQNYNYYDAHRELLTVKFQVTL